MHRRFGDIVPAAEQNAAGSWRWWDSTEVQSFDSGRGSYEVGWVSA